jgi:site-specific DNA-methyltransferase (adenine-specific)
VAENVLQHGTGGLNVDGCRIPMSYEDKKGEGGRMKPEHCNEDSSKHVYSDGWKRQGQNDTTGRWPANLIHDGSDEVVGLFPETETHTIGKALSAGRVEKTQPQGNAYGAYQASIYRSDYADAGSAARFFYCAKASKRDRGESNRHPTVKPTALMRYLCRLITPPGGLVLDPFTGSGSTGRGAVLEGFRFIGMELDAEHVEEAKRRILEVQNGWTDEPEDEPAEDLPGQRLLF